jgi:hypothetical protein
MNKKQSPLTFRCFNPFVMAVTAITELLLALYVLVKLPRNLTTMLGLSILLLLAVFQVAEYSICEGSIFSADTWSRIGFAAITLLPPLGVHLYRNLLGKKAGAIEALAYMTGGLWMVVFLSGNAIDAYQCTTNYLIFDLKPGVGGAYFVYYYIWLLYVLFGSANQWRLGTAKNHTSLMWLTIGYAAFIVPATFIWLLDGPAARGLPSIMCGFAILLAIILALKVLPHAKETDKKLEQ